jgi:hypothetical protein
MNKTTIWLDEVVPAARNPGPAERQLFLVLVQGLFQRCGQAQLAHKAAECVGQDGAPPRGERGIGRSSKLALSQGPMGFSQRFLDQVLGVDLGLVAGIEQ